MNIHESTRVIFFTILLYTNLRSKILISSSFKVSHNMCISMIGVEYMKTPKLDQSFNSIFISNLMNIKITLPPTDPNKGQV